MAIMKNLMLGTALMAGAGVLVLTTNALATPNSGFTTTNLSQGRFGEIDLKSRDGLGHELKMTTKGESDVHVVSNSVVPGGSSGWHTHPGPSLITVKQGTATFYDGDDPNCEPHEYTVGQGVIDPGDGHVHLLRNEGSVELVTVTVQILPAGATRRIDAPDPGNCNF